MFLLDTNVVSELRKAGSGLANTKVVAWASQSPASTFFLSSITIFELELGVLLMENKDQAQGRRLRDWFEQKVVRVFEGRVLPLNTQVAKAAAKLHVPNPRPDRDAFLASTALVNGLTLVTRNTKDFAGTGVKILNPWL
jgi:predicted nucleic acid-binding protein